MRSRCRSRRAAPTRRRSRRTPTPSPCSSRWRTGSATTSRPDYTLSAEELLVDKAQLMTLTAPEMTVLVGGMRALDANVGGSQHGVFTKRPGTLSNDFFVNLLDMGTAWKAVSEAEDVFEGRDRKTGELKWTRHPRRPRLRLELAAPRAGGGLWLRRRAGEVRARLRGGVDQGDEPRPLRSRLILAKERSTAADEPRRSAGRRQGRRGRTVRMLTLLSDIIAVMAPVFLIAALGYGWARRSCPIAGLHHHFHDQRGHTLPGVRHPAAPALRGGRSRRRLPVPRCCALR